MRKVFLDDLPKRGKLIDWKECIGKFVHFIYEDIEGDVEILDYISKDNQLKIKYNNDFYIATNNFKKCKLGTMLNKITTDFKIQLQTNIKDKKRDLIITDKEYRTTIDKNGWKTNLKWYKYTCNKCGWTEGWTTEGQLLKGVGCQCCHKVSIVEGINDIPTTAPWMIPYFQGGYEEAKLYAKSSKKEICPICPDCGRIKDTPIKICNIYQSHSINCTCSDGIKYPNKFAFNVLEQLNINFETEYSPDWIKPRRYDFYIPSINLILEMDGGFHNKDNNMSGQTKEESRTIDNYKDKLAEENGIKVIRIDCDYRKKNKLEYIKNNILHSELNELFDLKNINWNKCNVFASSNLVKTACELKKNNPDLTTIDIGKIMGGYNRSTICDWLKQGSGIWCDYDPKEEKGKNNNIGEIRSKPVICLNNKSRFNSSIECSEKIFKMYNVKISRHTINNICNKKQCGFGKKVNGEYLVFVYEEEYLQLTETEIYNKLHISKYINKQPLRRKVIYCYEENILFDGTDNCIDFFIKKGIKLNQGNISAVCRNIKKHYKRYTFKYIEDLTTEEYIKYDIENKLKELHNRELVQAC